MYMDRVASGSIRRATMDESALQSWPGAHIRPEDETALLDGKKRRILVGSSDYVYWSDWSTGDIDQDGPEPQPRQGRALHPPSYARLPECAVAGVRKEFLGELAEAWQHCRACHEDEASALLDRCRQPSRARVDGNEGVELEGVTALALDQQYEEVIDINGKNN
ncbi:uncharacterized protein LOC6588014 isoform X1 [Drosophila persimilis]|uniref:uncharacterized protein LOC6588014 isoform X1 n=1 Tax=Drosophila persimilis TaxID=7234 RepID=UPI000F086EC4|nr:uncharacterized protein LOC6588014 isoform X1 [Drosophila persimilis]